MNLAQRVLLTRRGRVGMFVVYAIAAVVSIIVYAIVRSSGYAVGEVVLFGFGAWWIYWCLRRPRQAE